MPEYRHDAILDRRVIVAADRAARPVHDGRGQRPPDRPVDVSVLPRERAADAAGTCRPGDGDPDTPGWRIRVVPNLYPIVGRREAGDATGAHEVVILCPDHDRDFAALDDADATDLFGVLRDRVRFHFEHGRAFVSVFVNHGRAAGASIEHPHAQIVAPDRPSDAVLAMTERFTTDLVAAELAEARRAGLVVVDGPAPAWCPPASWSPYQLRVAHRSTRARIEDATDAELAVVARGHARRPGGRGHGAARRALQRDRAHCAPRRAGTRDALARGDHPPHERGRRIRARQRHLRQLGRTRAGGRRLRGDGRDEVT